MTPTLIYFDFLCPYAWRGVELADLLRREHGLMFELRHFSLVQGNHNDNAQSRHQPTWWLTDQAAGSGSAAQIGSLEAFLADQAAARQSEEKRWAFALALFRAVHRDKAELSAQTIQAAAQTARLDMAQFQTDLAEDGARRAELRTDLAAAAEQGVFGTPTFVLPEGHAAYFRFANLVSPEKALETWQLYVSVLESDARIETIKRAKRA
ncbi:disulfide bond formation protein DsbA [Deinococcus psychrotolerans]|uniref:Disulfide bond formation protein DsbA n=1 Tax=Deinococcus psychrotolerans TaxID=2489213 RepID=A0A3G8YL14_9DEIO|nr:DsbA family protein [Deinococcus psychrotolerans]AZI41776.1 disulfide bond formation protein DsbA [Deinococcus psychrotolerans]